MFDNDIMGQKRIQYRVILCQLIADDIKLLVTDENGLRIRCCRRTSVNRSGYRETMDSYCWKVFE